MQILILNEIDVRRLCDLDELRCEMRRTLVALGENTVKTHRRHVLPVAEGALGFMGAENLARPVMGFKAVAVMPGNVARGMNPHQGVVAVMDSTTGRLRGLVEGSSLTALRTAAVSAAAAEALSRPEASRLALLGAGTQAIEHARAFAKIRALKKITVYNRSLERARATGEMLEKTLSVEVEISPSPRKAVHGADLVVTATAAREPLLSTLDLNEGAHLSAIGACRPGFREVDFQSRPGFKIFTDSQIDCEAEAEELIFAVARRQIGDMDIRGEVGRCLNGSRPGRESASDVTLFKAVGLGIEDLAAADFLLKSAVQKGLGREIDL